MFWTALSNGAKKFDDARQKYDEALSIVTIVSGMSGGDQKEIDTNRAACLMNIAAVCMAVKDFGEAVRTPLVACLEAMIAPGVHFEFCTHKMVSCTINQRATGLRSH